MQWSNASATGYMVYAIHHYNNRVAEFIKDDENPDELRILTEDEIRMLMNCLQYAFDKKTPGEAYEICDKWELGLL